MVSITKSLREVQNEDITMDQQIDDLDNFRTTY